MSHASKFTIGGRRVLFGLALAGVVIGAGAYKHRVEVPLYAALSGYACLALLAVSLRPIRLRWLYYNIAFVFLAVAVVEAACFYGWVGFERRVVHAGGITSGYFRLTPDLGYGAVPGRRTTSASAYVGGRRIYDVEYSLDEHGLRTTSGASTRPGPPAYFFGCSFTFGEGVSDADTLPAFFERASGRRAVNFGFHGYGPHQALRALEIGLPRRLGFDPPALAVFTLLPAHVDRAAGRSGWDMDGPRYLLVDHRPRFVGPFSRSRTFADKVLEQSATLKVLRGRFGSPSTERVDRERIAAILVEADRIARADYGVPLRVLLWDLGPSMTPLLRERAEWFKSELPRRGLIVTALSERSPQLSDPRFYIAGDSHPTATGYAQALQVVNELAAIAATGANTRK